ncbi:hypothetical protein FACS1894145_4330 [Bacteroidia bacterium]|nr:hypothetical protein FACS1894145_4330 [Bacteroidia bacterium]
MKPKDFVEKYYPFALKTQEEKGIDARFTLAQTAVESGWGEHAPGNNFFGIKAPKSAAVYEKQLLKTKEVFKDKNQGNRFPKVISMIRRADGKYLYTVKDWFRKYTTPDECFSDHADFFSKYNRYAEALKYKSDPNRFAEEIAKAGYATDPNYAKTLKSVIKTIEKNIPV